MCLRRESRVDVWVPLNNQNTASCSLHDTSLPCTLLPPADQEDWEAVCLKSGDFLGFVGVLVLCHCNRSEMVNSNIKDFFT